MVTESPGRQALVQFLEAEPGRSQRWLARLLEVGQSCVSLWVRGQCCPDNVHIEALRIVAGIPTDAWLTEADRQKLTRISMKTHAIQAQDVPRAPLDAVAQA